MTDEIGRHEFAQLVRRVDDNQQRLNTIDATGTRGVAVLAVQLQEIAKDFAKHEEKHEREERDRRSNRRWIIATAIAMIGLMVAILTFLFDLRAQIR